MSVELISVLIAMLAVGATLGGLILTATRGLMTACHRRREMSTIVVTIVLSLMGLSSCGEAEETTSRSTATSEEELAAQLGADTEPVDAGHNRNIDVGTLSTRAGAPTDGEILARWEPSPEMAKTLRLPFFEKATLTYRAGKMILVSQYGDGGRLERVLVERPAGEAAERKFDLQTQDRPEYFTLSETGVVRYFSWEGGEFKTASVSFIDPDAMNIGNSVQQRPCIPTKLSPAAMELVRLYDQLHAFKDDPEFIRVGFAGAPYSAWLQAIERHRDTNSGLELLDELGFLPGELMMLGMNYLGEDLSESDLSFIEDSERKIQAGLALTRCNDPGSEWQEIVQASLKARQAYAAEGEAQLLARESLLGRPLTDEELVDVEFEKLRGVLGAGIVDHVLPLTKSSGERCFEDEICPSPWIQYERTTNFPGQESETQDAWSCQSRSRWCWVAGGEGGEGCFCSGTQPSGTWTRVDDRSDVSVVPNRWAASLQPVTDLSQGETHVAWDELEVGNIYRLMNSVELMAWGRNGPVLGQRFVNAGRIFVVREIDRLVPDDPWYHVRVIAWATIGTENDIPGWIKGTEFMEHGVAEQP